MPNPWDTDPVVGGHPWEADPVVGGGVTSTEQPARQPEASLFRMDSDFRKRAGVSPVNMAVAAAKDMFGSRKGAAEYLAGKSNEGRGLSSLVTGSAQVVQDENGDPIVRLPDGTSYRLNDPGIDSADIGNVAGNIAAFFTPAGWAAKVGQTKRVGLVGNALRSLRGRAATQAGAAGATDAGLQAAFDGGNIDLGRTASAAAGGAGGELVGTAIGAGAARVAASRRATEESGNLAKRLGVEATPDRAPALASGAEEIRAGANPAAIMGRERFGFQYTQGQRATDPAQRFNLLSREEVLRQKPGAAHVFEEAGRHNREQLGQAVTDIGERLGSRPGATPSELAQGAAGRVKQQADDLQTRIGAAYEKAGEGGRAAVGVDAVSELPNRLRTALSDMAPDADLHPVTSKTLQQIRDATEFAQRDGVKGITLKAIEQRRRIINSNMGAVSNPADRRAMGIVKREFDAWLDNAVETALVSGDPAALTALKDARALRTEFGRRFEGKEQADKFISGLLDGSRTPEELVNIALGAGQVSKAGGARFIERLRVAADNDPEVIGTLRAAHFQRLTIGNNGEPLQMGQIVRNIKTTEYSNASILKALYSPEEWKEIRALADALDPLIPKGDFARTSGTAERLFRGMMGMMGGGLRATPFVGKPLAAGRAWMAADRAINKPLRLPAQAPTGSQAVAAGAFDERAR